MGLKLQCRRALQPNQLLDIHISACAGGSDVDSLLIDLHLESGRGLKLQCSGRVQRFNLRLCSTGASIHCVLWLTLCGAPFVIPYLLLMLNSQSESHEPPGFFPFFYN